MLLLLLLLLLLLVYRSMSNGVMSFVFVCLFVGLYSSWNWQSLILILISVSRVVCLFMLLFRNVASNNQFSWEIKDIMGCLWMSESHRLSLIITYTCSVTEWWAHLCCKQTTTSNHRIKKASLLFHRWVPVKPGTISGRRETALRYGYVLDWNLEAGGLQRCTCFHGPSEWPII